LATALTTVIPWTCRSANASVCSWLLRTNPLEAKPPRKTAAYCVVIVIRWEYYAENFLGMVQLACAVILLRHL
jgi:hypothetical protein